MILIWKRRLTGKVLRISSWLLMLGLLSLPTWSQNKPGRVDRNLAKIEEFKEIRKRADAIQNALTSSDPDAAEQGKADRLDLIKELERWAKKYKVQVSQMNETRPLQVKDRKVVTSSRCDQVVEVMGKVCFAHYGFFDHSAYQCIYKCVPKNQTTINTEKQSRITLSDCAR